MAKRRMGLLTLALWLCICLACPVLAASTLDAKAPIDTEAEGKLTVFCGYDGSVFSQVPVSLYQVARVSGDFQYTLTGEFAASGLQLNGIQTTGEWNSIRATLEAYCVANATEVTMAAITDAEGNAVFEGLKPGLYLAVPDKVVQEERTYVPASALIALPGLGTDGYWQYTVSAAAKVSVLPPQEQDVQWKVVKLWNKDFGTGHRPESIRVEIFRDGESVETVTLSEENQWMYTWTAQPGADYQVIERDVPAGYVMTLENRDNAFVITNTWTEENPDEPPETGDSSHIMLYVILLILSGSLLVILGVTGKRKDT